MEVQPHRWLSRSSPGSHLVQLRLLWVLRSKSSSCASKVSSK